MIKVAVRSPGKRAWTRKTDILTYRTFYGVLKEMARKLLRRVVTHVVMEASGIYTDPVRDALVEVGGFEEVMVVNAAHVKALKGHKTDARDAARLAELLECGLLRGSYIPSRGAEGGAGPGALPGQDGPGPRLGGLAARQDPGIGWHQARIGRLRHYRE